MISGPLPRLPELAELRTRTLAPPTPIKPPGTPQVSTIPTSSRGIGVFSGDPLMKLALSRVRQPQSPGGSWQQGAQVADTTAIRSGVAPGSLRGAPGVVRLAASQIGTPYVFGAENPDGSFDCSGLTSWAYGRMGVELPHNAAQQMSVATPVGAQDLRPGMLVFSNYGRLGPGIADHVQIYAGGGRVVGAQPSTSGVAVTPIDWDNVIGFGAVPGVNYGRTTTGGTQSPSRASQSASQPSKPSPKPVTRRTPAASPYAR